jgi:formylmethanofuran dehydrogenase subunit E
MGKTGKITLGADPEFELIVDGHLSVADDLLENDIDLPWGVIGKDGAGDQLELRPKPAYSPSVLVKNVGRLLLSVPNGVGALPSTMGEEYPLGGHIHIGGVSKDELEGALEVVDDAFGHIFYHMNSEARLDSSYGQVGDWRPQPWGVEYRTPPASVWSHPEVALTFLRAIKWVAEKVLEGEDPFEHPAWPFVHAATEKAAEFVKAHEGRLHWGAWREYVGRTVLSSEEETLEVVVEAGPQVERDEAFVGDIVLMCRRLGIPRVKIIPLHQRRGEFASNVPGYGDIAEDFSPYKPLGSLALSWRLRNDPEFRRAEMPKLERAIAQLLEKPEVGDGGRLVRDAVPFTVVLPVDLLEEDLEENKGEVRWDPADSVECEACGLEMSQTEAHFNREGVPFCEERYHDRYETCGFCGREVEADNAYYDEHTGSAYCESCFWEHHTTCTSCDSTVSKEEAQYNEQGDPFCGECYLNTYTRCEECGREVTWEDAERHDDLYYCPSCYASLFVSCERCGAEVPQEEAHYYEETPYCEECFFLEHDFCANCGESVLKESAPMTEGQFYCESCHDWLFAQEGARVAVEA